MIATLKSALYALYIGAALFAFQLPATYLIWMRWLKLLPARVVLGLAIFNAVIVALYAFVEHRAGRV